MSFDAIILAGGAGRRIGGRDKAEIQWRGRRMLDVALDAAASAERVVVVGPRRPTDRDVEWALEDPAGSGPAAALEAGLPRAVSATIVVLAVDQPLLGPPDVERLIEGIEGRIEAGIGAADGCMLVDDSGRDQPLAAAYRRDALVRRLATRSSWTGVSMRTLLTDLRLNRIPGAGVARDIDTAADLDDLGGLSDGMS